MFTLGYDERSFSAEVIERFGTVEPDLVDDKEFLHCQMATLADLVRQDSERATAVLSFLEEVLSRRDAISEIENAVAISFLDWRVFQAREDWVKAAPRASAVVRRQWELEGHSDT